MLGPMATLDTRDTLVYTIHAPPEEVYKYWIHPQLIRRWMAPPHFAVKEAEVDARVGGSYRIVAVDPAGDVHVTTGRYRDLVPGKRLVKTWIYEGPLAPSGRSESTLTVEMRESRPGVTQLTLRRSP